MSEATKTDRTAEFFIMFTAELPNKRGMQLNLSLYEDETPGKQWEKINRADELIEDIRAKHELPIFESVLKQKKDALVAQIEIVENATAKVRERKPGITQQEKNLVENGQSLLAKGKADIEQGEAEIARRKARLVKLTEAANDA